MEISVGSYRKIVSTWWVLRLFYGVVPIIAGLDKLLAFNKLTQWSQYLGGLVQQIIPLEAMTLISVVGVIEIGIGLLILAGLTRLGGWLLMILLLMISANLVSMGLFYDIAVRDILIAIGALALVWLSEIKDDIEH